MLNWEEYFLKDAVLLQIFSCDSKSEGINDIINPFVVELDEASDEDGDADEENGEQNNEDDEENQLQKQFYDRYYVKQHHQEVGDDIYEPEEIVRTKAPMNLQGLSHLTFESLAEMMKDAQSEIEK